MSRCFQIEPPIDPRFRYAWVRIIAGGTVFESVIVLGILGFAALLGGTIGYPLGARRAANELVNIFKRQVALTDDDLKALDALARRRTLLDDGSLGEIARILHVAVRNEFMDEQERSREPKPGESSLTMQTSDRDDVATAAVQQMISLSAAGRRGSTGVTE